jgi:hypothetical protein
MDKNYAYALNEGGIICRKCANNPLYVGELELQDKEGYPDGYTCAECGKVSK